MFYLFEYKLSNIAFKRRTVTCYHKETGHCRSNQVIFVLSEKLKQVVVNTIKVSHEKIMSHNYDKDRKCLCCVKIRNTPRCHYKIIICRILFFLHLYIL